MKGLHLQLREEKGEGGIVVVRVPDRRDRDIEHFGDILQWGLPKVLSKSDLRIDWIGIVITYHEYPHSQISPIQQPECPTR